jgi:hypothetical protein
MRTTPTNTPARALLAFALLALAPSNPAADDCEYCKPRKICSVHRGEDAEALDALAERLDSASAEERRAALEEAAALTLSHANHRSTEVAKFLAKGLEDDDAAVRARAAELLAKGQHVEVAVAELVATLADVKKALRDAPEGEAERALVLDYARRVVAALGALPDDRVATALTGFLETGEAQPWGEPLRAEGAVALAALGRRDGVAWALERWSALSTPDRDRLRAALEVVARARELETPPATDASPEAVAAWGAAAEARLPRRLGKLEAED